MHGSIVHPAPGSVPPWGRMADDTAVVHAAPPVEPSHQRRKHFPLKEVTVVVEASENQ